MIAVSKLLIDLVTNHGEDILQQPQRIKAMLADLLPNEKRLRFLLELSFRAEIPAKLKDIQQNDKEVREAKTNSLKHYFKKEYFLEDNAVKSVFDCWIDVLLKNYSDCETVTDIDGNVYKTVQIGTQTWMAENLRVSRYRNGDIIPNIENNEERRSIIATGACCNYNYNLDYDFEYGKLYNWYVVDDKRGLAPKGWHVPSAKEWLILIDFLGGKYIAGGKLKEAGTKHWETPNKGATNESGFTALPAGNSTGSGYFGSIGSLGEWWGATIWSGGGNRLKLWTIGADLHLEGCSPSWSLSVRCLKDY